MTTIDQTVTNLPVELQLLLQMTTSEQRADPQNYQVVKSPIKPSDARRYDVDSYKSYGQIEY